MEKTVPPSARRTYRGAGRTIEEFVWRFRSYFIPSHLRTFRQILRAHLFQPADAGRKIVCFDFTKVDIDADGGRYVFLLVREFETLGFLVCYRLNYRFLATMRHKEFKRLLLARDFRVQPAGVEFPKNSSVIEVTDRVRPAAKLARRSIHVRYDATLPLSADEVAMPFMVHPANYDRCVTVPAPNLAGERPWRIFFGGSTGGLRYGSNVLSETFGKMSRGEILKTLEAHLPADRLRHIQSAADLKLADLQPSFVWAGNHPAYTGVPSGEWLDVLGRADFFLACPGVGMPLCHNLIEALAQGTVPILEHPEFFDPPLEHNVNCLVFQGRDELLQIFQHIFDLTPQHIHRLRESAYAYYENHLAPGRLAQRLLDLPHERVDILLNACQSPRPPTAPRPQLAPR